LKTGNLSAKDPFLYLHAFAVFMAVFGFFFVGFVNLARFQNPKISGIVIGLFSALFWAFGSIGAEVNLSNRANRYAAFCAAMSLGLLTPLQSVCPVPQPAGWLPGVIARFCQ
jgi:drug/metabolite transporter (DMT)-like permease